MHPILFHLAGRPIHTYGLCAALGFLAAICTFVWIDRKHSWDFAADVGCWAIIGGIIGARMAYITANWDFFRTAPLLEMIRIDKGGLIFYGGLIGGILAIGLLAFHKKLSIAALLDYVAPGMPIAHALGRFGCFMNGCCYGAVAKNPVWGIAYPPGSEPGTQFPAIPLYPVQLFEAACLLIIWGILVFRARRPHREGAVLTRYLLLYPPCRFALEYLRGDDRLAAGMLNTAQVVSILLFLGGIVAFFFFRRRNRA